ncbi:MAG: methionyl-tRNA formyltransferase [Clostridiales bacterium]|nr:methionyl-tRNA formyltransferase [Clostridiales bacterium]
MKIIFMGTPDFAVECLRQTVDAGYDIETVFTQPDKPVGRKRILTPPPVKSFALGRGLSVYQPESLKDAETVDFIKSINADVIIVVAYGKILSSDILNSARYGCINVHASLLPKYRGAAPIQRAIINGEKETGVSIMQMDEGIDTGDILFSQSTPIGENETSSELFDRLAVMGGNALLKTLGALENGKLNPTKQPDGDFGYAEKITKELCPIDWNKSALQVHNLVRGLQDSPCAQTVINGKIFKIHKTVLSLKTGNKAGEIVDNKDVITVCCGDGKCVDITELQAQGKNRMKTADFLRGNKIEISSVLGE